MNILITAHEEFFYAYFAERARLGATGSSQIVQDFRSMYMAGGEL